MTKKPRKSSEARRRIRAEYLKAINIADNWIRTETPIDDIFVAINIFDVFYRHNPDIDWRLLLKVFK